MTATLDGPRLAPAAGGRPKQLVIFCHGYGADGNDLIGLGQQWRGLLPEAAFVSPHAPQRCTMSSIGYQWFPISRLDPQETWIGVQDAAPALDAFIDAELARNGLDDGQMALVGFSQGTMLALHVGLRRKRAPAAVLGYAGALAGPEHLDGQITARPPVMLIHGDLDEVIPVSAVHMAAGALGAADVNVQWHVSPGIGHGIDGAGLALGGEFLRTALATSRV